MPQPYLHQSPQRRASSFLFLVALLAALPGHAQLPAGTQDAGTQEAATQEAATQEAAQPSPLQSQANEALEKSDYPTALKLLTALAAENPSDAHLLYDLAYTQEALDQSTSAESTYRQAIAADPTLTEPHLALGLLLARTAHPAEAHAELTTATTLAGAPPPLRARAYRALARLDLKPAPDAARDELVQALKLSPETPDDTLLAAQLAESASDPAAAEHAYRRTLAASPNDPAATAALAHLLTPAHPAEAESLLTAALTAHPADPALTAQLVTLYAAQRNYPQALALAGSLHAAHPDDANITRLLAHLASQAGDYARADPLYATLLASHPDAPLQDDRADTLIHLRRFAEAEALLKQAVAAGPAAFPSKEDFGLAAAHLAFAASNNSDPATTLRALDQRATVLPPSPSALFLQATAYDKLHDFHQAADLYNKFLAAANGQFPDEEFEARHRLLALQKRN